MKYAGKKLPPMGVGDCVQIPITCLDKSRLEGGYLVGVVIRITTD